MEQLHREHDSKQSSLKAENPDETLYFTFLETSEPPSDLG